MIKIQNQFELSVVILCYRAEEGVFDFVRRVKEVFEKNSIKDYELILVGNYKLGERDATPRIVRQIAMKDRRVRFVAEYKQGMMGWDMRQGLKLAQGDYLAVIDGDGQMPVGDLVRVFEEIKAKKSDLAKTYRVTRGDGLWRKTISFFYNIAFCLLFPGLKSKDINSKPKIMTREFFSKLNLRSDDWFIDAEIMIQARRHKALISEIPTDFLGLSGRRKSFVKLGAVFEFLWNLAVFRIREYFSQDR